MLTGFGEKQTIQNMQRTQESPWNSSKYSMGWSHSKHHCALTPSNNKTMGAAIQGSAAVFQSQEQARADVFLFAGNARKLCNTSLA